MTGVRAFEPILKGTNPSLAAPFLQRLGRPWRLMANGAIKPFSPASAAQMPEWINKHQVEGKSVYFIPPVTDRGHEFLVGRVPRNGSPAALMPPPQFTIVSDDFTCLWRLAEPVGEQQAKRMTARLVAQQKGSVAIGEPIPLPGTLHAREMGLRMSRRYPVMALPPLKTPAYHHVGDEIRQEVKQIPFTETLDPTLMAVPIGEGVTWQPGGQSNGFMLVLGASGSGKTETLKTIGGGIHRHGIPVLVFDFHGDVILPGVPSTALSSAPGAIVGLNPLEVDVGSARENGLYDQRTATLEMVRRAVPQLGHKQANALHVALEAAYLATGIEDDNPETWTRPAPTLAQLMATIEDPGLLAGVRTLFGHPIFDRREHLSIENLLAASMRLDLSKLPEGVRYITAETLLRRIFTALRMRGPIPVKPANDKERFRLFVIIDEARLITMGGNSDIVTALANEARKFGLGMILASQAAGHFPHEIRNNAASWLVLKPQSMQEAKLNAPNIGVEPEQLMELKGRGDGYLRLGNAAARRVQVRPDWGKK